MDEVMEEEYWADPATEVELKTTLLTAKLQVSHWGSLILTFKEGEEIQPLKRGKGLRR